MSIGPLGKETSYRSEYDPTLLFGISRDENRRLLLKEKELPFVGVDIWNGYEISWLDEKGKPVRGVMTAIVPFDSPRIAESKSFKLYLNSLNQYKLKDIDACRDLVWKDVSQCVGTDKLALDILPYEEWKFPSLLCPEGICLDALECGISEYDCRPELLCLDKNSSDTISEKVYTHLFKSNCPVTNQPDWATIMIHYTGRKINHESLLKYLVSYRMHNGFHETCVESVFVDLLERCKPDSLVVKAHFLRRGGIDINPIRSTLLT